MKNIIFLNKKKGKMKLWYLNSLSKSMKFNDIRQESDFLYAYMHNLTN